MTTKKYTLAIIMACGVILYSCYSHNWDTINALSNTGGGGSSITTTCTVTAATVISYSTTIAPLVNSYCANSPACHAAGVIGSSPQDLSFYGSAGSHGSGLASVCSGGDTSSATVWNYIRGTHGAAQMPLGGAPLPSCQIQELKNWIQQGAPQN